MWKHHFQTKETGGAAERSDGVGEGSVALALFQNWHSTACCKSRYKGFRPFLLGPGRVRCHRRHSTACGQSRSKDFQRKMLVPGRNRRDVYGDTRVLARCRVMRGTSHRRRFEKMDYSPRADAPADSRTALDGEAGRRNGQGDRGERSPVDEQLDRAQRGPRVCRGATAIWINK